MKKIVLTLYTSHDGGSAIPFSDPKYQRCYEALYTLAAEQGVVFCRASTHWFDPVEKRFSQAWFFDNKKWIIKPAVTPDIIYDKTAFGSVGEDMYQKLIENYPVVNAPEFTAIAGNKYTVSRLLPDFFKPYLLVPNSRELPGLLKKIPGRLLVAKPLSSSGGEGVVISSADELLKTHFDFPIILQEFIDSSGGIPGIITGHHDLRLVFVNDSLVYSYVRVPKPGSLLANVAQGGRMIIVGRDALPQSVLPAVEAVKRAFARFPKKIYTIDLMFDEHAKPWIVELNTMPGIYFEPGQEETRDKFYRDLIRGIID